ncbi:MAG TPA: FlgD immunoglobulin-like domain containing protein [Candidatus Krumholzibacteria bacterium]|nr:FlgD immunoglobulin-like domain containing protein [Candidatus Krumholzibacteria bacterium]HPD73303.1 FlgD immunoglobulin-like domain containing protein [Candidatus Krumholzibacteria bacterium]HRY42019.1 FlgD immunoglobulin-like domain containing protein [Candidatus Krumholzibacteria bacterium]
MLLLIGAAVLARADGGGSPEVQGIIGITPVPEGACLGVYVPMAPDRALAGVMWYNNDETVVFPAVMIASGVAGTPEPISAALQVAADVTGVSSGWSELTFTEPVAAQNDGFYIVFRLPEGSEHTADGYGGGAGIGYTEGENGFTGWISLDGEEWVKLQASFGMAIEPITVEREDGMAEKDADEETEIPVTHTALLLPSPNPFNPQTDLHYRLKDASQVDLSIYNLKGERVARLASGPHAAGRYSVPWRGVDEAGQRLASGTYIARFVAGHVVQTQRLTLVK